MPVIADTSQEASLRLHRAAEPLDPPDDRIVIQTGWPQAAGFAVSQALYDAYQADLANPAPALPNCRANAPCYSSLCGEGQTAATGATAGTPGSWTGGYAPASVEDLQNGSPAVVASPTTAWTTGQYVQTGTPGEAGQAYWNGTAWVAGVSSTAPTPPAPTFTAVSPTSATAGTASQVVTLTGTNFVAGAELRVEASPDPMITVPITVTTPTSGTATLPGTALDTPGSITLSVVTAGGVSESQLFNVT